MALLLAAIGTIALVGLRPLAVEAVYPVEHARMVATARIWPRITGLFRASAVNRENVRLKREIASLKLLRGDLERLEVENARLRRALDYASRKPEIWLSAGVLSRGGGAAGVRDSIRVDKGTLAGVRKGAIVVVPEGLVGQVSSVSPHTAEIVLVTDPSLKVACTVEMADTGACASGILSGGSEDMLLLRYLRNADKVLPRSRVLTSGRGGVFPAGIEVGTLLGVTNRVRSVEGEVRPRVDYSTLEDVFIRRDK